MNASCFNIKLFFILLFFIFNQVIFSQEKYVAFFDSDQFELTTAENTRLKEWIAQNSDSKIISINGFTDEIGTNLYNDTLSRKRVNFVYELIKGKIKFRNDFKTIGFGETQISSIHHEENRKVEIIYLEAFDIQHEEYIVNDYLIKKKLERLNLNDSSVIYNTTDKNSLIALDKVSVGQILVLNNVEFYRDSDVLLPSAKKELNNWATVFKKKLNIKFVIKGHVCCVAQNNLYLNSLSSRRAQTVLNYLETQGVSKERMDFVGYGSSKPIYQIPEKNGYEALKNRRVEIQIIEN